MRRQRLLKGLKFLLIAPLFAAILGGVVMRLWNTLVPELFGGRPVTFWQALGLLVLCRILVGGIGGRGRGMHWRHRMMERWEQMSPEEREKFRAGLHRKDCGGSPAASPEN